MSTTGDGCIKRWAAPSSRTRCLASPAPNLIKLLTTIRARHYALDSGTFQFFWLARLRPVVQTNSILGCNEKKLWYWIFSYRLINCSAANNSADIVRDLYKMTYNSLMLPNPVKEDRNAYDTSRQCGVAAIFPNGKPHNVWDHNDGYRPENYGFYC